MSAETVLSTIPQTVGAVWAFLVLFIWHTYKEGKGTPKLMGVFILMTLTAVISIITSIWGLHYEITKDSLIYYISLGSVTIFIILVGIYYSLICFIILQNTKKR